MSGPFVCYRLLLAALVLCALIGCLVDAGHQPIWSAAAVSLPGAVPRASLRHWPVYLTNLGLLGLAVHLALSAAVVVERLVHHHHHGATEAKMTWLTRLSWLFYTTTTVIGLTISLVFWTVIFPFHQSDGLSFVSIVGHALNSVVLLADLWISGRPWRLAHVYQPMAVLVGYVIFLVVYWSAGGTNHFGHNYVYKAFDMGRIWSTWPFLFLPLIVLPIHGLVWALHAARDGLHRRWCVLGR